MPLVNNRPSVMDNEDVKNHKILDQIYGSRRVQMKQKS